MYQLAYPAHRRLVLHARPAGQLHDFELIYWFRTWLAEEHYLGCLVIVKELRCRELSGQLPVALLVDGFRDKYSGQPNFDDLNGLLAAWPARYPHLFTRRAAYQWLLKQTEVKYF